MGCIISVVRAQAPGVKCPRQKGCQRWEVTVGHGIVGLGLHFQPQSGVSVGALDLLLLNFSDPPFPQLQKEKEIHVFSNIQDGFENQN